MSQKQSTERRHELRNNTEIVANQLTLHSEEIQALSGPELLMVNAAIDMEKETIISTSQNTSRDLNIV